MGAPTRIQVRDIGGGERHGWVAASTEPGEYIDAGSYEDAVRALAEIERRLPGVARTVLSTKTRLTLQSTRPASTDSGGVLPGVVAPKLDGLSEGDC